MIKTTPITHKYSKAQIFNFPEINCNSLEALLILGQSGVGNDLEAGKTYFGSPCGEARTKFKEMAAFKRLPSIIENL